MVYLYKASELAGKADDIIARFAAGEYGEDGTSAYDLIRTTQRDKSILAQYADDALLSLLAQVRNIYEGKHFYWKWDGTISGYPSILTRKRNIRSGDTPYDINRAPIASSVLTIAPHATNESIIVATPAGEGAQGVNYTIDDTYGVLTEHVFYTPDFDEEKNTDELTFLIEQYIAEAVVARWFQDKYPAGVQTYADRSASSLARAISLMYTRKRVCRSQ